MTTQRLISVLTAGSLALMVTGCSTDDGTDATLSDVSPITPASSPDHPSVEAPSSETTKEDTEPTVHASTGNDNNNGNCATSQLDISLTNEQGAAGSRLADILFTNAAGEPCSLTGFPGVSAVTNDDGTQLGRAAEREAGLDTATVTLNPGESARAGLKMTVVGIMDPATCQPQSADGLRVYPPGETASAFIRVEGLQGCAGDANYLSVQPVTAG